MFVSLQYPLYGEKERGEKGEREREREREREHFVPVSVFTYYQKLNTTVVILQNTQEVITERQDRTKTLCFLFS